MMGDYSFPPERRNLFAVPSIEDRLSPSQVAGLLGVTDGTLRNWRSQRKGPPFYKVGRVFYSRMDVHDWLAKQRTRFHGT